MAVFPNTWADAATGQMPLVADEIQLLAASVQAQPPQWPPRWGALIADEIQPGQTCKAPIYAANPIDCGLLAVEISNAKLSHPGEMPLSPTSG